MFTFAEVSTFGTRRICSRILGLSLRFESFFTAGLAGENIRILRLKEELRESYYLPVWFVIYVNEFVVLERFVTSIAYKALLMPCCSKGFDCRPYICYNISTKRR